MNYKLVAVACGANYNQVVIGEFETLGEAESEHFRRLGLPEGDPEAWEVSNAAQIVDLKDENNLITLCSTPSDENK